MSIPAFIAKETDIKASQRPYAELAANGAFEIRHVRADEDGDEHQHDNRKPIPARDSSETAGQQRYFAQQNGQPETEVIQKIWQLPRCRLWSRPMEFRKARFRNLDDCAAFVASAIVRSQTRWAQYPWFNTPPESDREFVAAEIDFVEPSMQHTERWALFQSGQFVQNMAWIESCSMETVSTSWKFWARLGSPAAYLRIGGFLVPHSSSISQCPLCSED